jgi:hypothetical protein
MRIQKPFVVAILVVCVLAVVGCHRQGDANAEMAKAVKELEQATPGQPQAPAVPPAAAAEPAAPAEQPSQPAITSQPVAVQMSQAMASYKGGDYSDAIIRLQLLRTKVTTTPQQTMAIQDAVAAVMAELYARGEKGDTRAQQAIKQWQEVRNKPN